MSARRRVILLILLTVLPCVALAACADLSKPYPAKESFAFSSPAVARAGVARPGVLRVDRVRVADPFDARSFHYRLSDTRYETDYYNEFVADPDQLLTAELVRLLSGAGVFDTVVDPPSAAEGRFRLETSVLDLSTDFRDKGTPRAVIRARFLLLEDAREATKVLGDWTVESHAPLRDDAPASIAAGLSSAWSDAVGQLVTALGR